MKNKTTKPFSLIHTDICGPMQVPTVGGMRYMAIFIDDYSRYTECYLLKNKNELGEKLRHYIAKGINKFGRKPEKLRSDCGGEYVNDSVDSYLRNEGIIHEKTVPYTPQQNGKSERKNRSIIEIAKCMLMDAGLDNYYWGEAVVTATYMQNRLPHTKCDKTPYELWNQKKPDLGHIRKFGCTVYGYIPKEKRKKLDQNAFKGKLMGYSEVTKGYRILVEGTNRIEISRSVQFNEDINKIDSDTRIKSDYWLQNCLNENVQVEISLQKNETIPEVQAKNEQTPQTKDGIMKQTQEGELNLRRSLRENKGQAPQRLSYMIQNKHLDEPQSWKEVQELNDRDKKVWISAMNEEMRILKENNTWDLVELPVNKRTISCKWIYKTKLDAHGNVERHKARLVAKGYSQKYGDEYDMIFAPVVKHTSIRSILAIITKRQMKTCHLDVNAAFLNARLQEEIYMEQPEGLVEMGKEDLVCKLNNCIYGLKQSAREWNSRLNDILVNMGFTRGIADPCVYTKLDGKIHTYILVYVDDLLICSDELEVVKIIKQLLEKSFEIKDLGEVKYYLGINIDKDCDGNYVIHQRNKIESLSRRFGLENSRSISTPMECDYLKLTNEESDKSVNPESYREAVGALLYISTTTRPDIALSTGLLGRKVNNPSHNDWLAVKRVIKYLKTTIDKGLFFGKEDIILECYTDADWGGDLSDRKSTSGNIFKLGNNTVAWSARKQPCVATSSTEAEYVAAANACQELLWMKQLLKDLGYEQQNAIPLYEDNQSCIKLATGGGTKSRSKHIDIRFHLLKDLSENGTICLKYCETELMQADIMTKPITGKRFLDLTHMMGIKNIAIE